MNKKSKKPNPIGREIRRLRQEKGLNITELAEKIGVSRSYLSQIELESVKSPTIDTAKKIANALGISVSELINEKEPQEHGSATAYGSPLNSEEIKKFADEKNEKEVRLDKETREDLEKLVEILTDVEIPIQELDRIRARVVKFAEFLRYDVKN